MGVFKAYDVRGLVPEELDAALARRVGAATARFLGAGKLVVGRDARSHSPELAAALAAGVRSAGGEVVDLGCVSTPMVYYAVEALGADGGIMVTASHNPAAYNGFKICREHAVPVGEATGLEDIERLAAEEPPGEAGDAPPGTRTVDVTPGYLAHVQSVGGRLPEGRLRVAIDCGNGMAGVALTPLLAAWEARSGIRSERLYFEPDGTFPNHEADPLKAENLEDLCRLVRDTGADLGVAFDGDGDRAVFVDGAGYPVSSDLMTALFARVQLRKQPGGLVLYDLRSSRVVAEEVERAGGRAEMCRVGHSFVKAQMRDTGAVFAGELSGHFYFRFSEQLVADDGVAALCAALDLLADDPRPLAELVAPLRRYHASGELNRRVADAPGLLAAIEREHRGAPVVSRLDGLYVGYEDWWFNLRPSNTEPVLRLNLEADSREQMVRERDRLLARMEAGG